MRHNSNKFVKTVFEVRSKIPMLFERIFNLGISEILSLGDCRYIINVIGLMKPRVC